jgi:diguanylate cyclase (GGDEF)-like protein/PAS domain S-box-containing protein
VTYWADSAERLFGYSAADAAGQLFGELMPFEIAGGNDETGLLETIRAAKTWRGEGSVRRRDGTDLWLESTVSPIVIDGAVVGSVSVSRDVTAAIAARRGLAAEQRFVDAVLDAARSPVIVTDAEGLVVRFNRACEELSGFTSGEVVGKPYWATLVAPDEADIVRESFLALRGGAAPRPVENHWTARDGSRRLIAWATATLTDPDGRVTHLIGTGTDITDQRRTEDALRGIEAVAEQLARQGPEPAVLDSVVAAIAAQLGTRHVALFWLEDTVVRLGSQVGYPDVAVEFDPNHGVVGRVLRTGDAALVPDVRVDPDYHAGDPEVASEIAVPLRAEGRTFGVLNIESTAASPLSEVDLRLTTALADRLSGALVLGREQRGLAERARMFAALTEFARAASSILQSERLWPALIDAVGAVVSADVIAVTVLEQSTGRYVLRAVRGMEEAAIGTEIRPGEGSSGQAIATRSIVILDDAERRQSHSAIGDRVRESSLSTLAVPLIREDVVLGAITVGRAGPAAAFSRLEAEVMTLLGAQAALALANARLLDEVSELAVRDGLTGLFNRRHFDASLELVLARWRREIADARPLSAVLFDLDHFGRFNKEHGHQAGDAVLREFAGILRARFRASDLVGRYGGEEFVVIMEGATREQALMAADEVRHELESRLIPGPTGQRLRAHVSAGVAAFDPTDPSPEGLLQTADVALAMAKRAGRNQVVAA